MTTKPGVSVAGLQAEAVYGLMIVQEVFRKHSREMIVTSGTDGKHSPRFPPLHRPRIRCAEPPHSATGNRHDCRPLPREATGEF